MDIKSKALLNTSETQQVSYVGIEAGPGCTIINKRGLGLGYYEYKDRTPGDHQRANSQSVSIPAGV